MRWKTAGLCALALAGGLGCPHSFGRGGTIDRAAHKDSEQMLVEPDPCSPEERKLYCEEDPHSEECIERCG